ncbi:unnamed protein product [Musa acuminata subsp. burmannicoides]
MGKAGKDQTESALPASSVDRDAGDGYARLRSVGRIVRPRCVAALVLGAAMLLSVLFWLPPFLRHHGARRGHRRDPRFAADIVASFKLQKPVAELNANIVKLQLDIFEEIGVPNSSVAIISLEPLGGSNWTNVVFGVWPYPKNSTISSTGLSILRSSFMSLVIQQSTLHLTRSLFGNSSLFEVQKFPGGITIIPLQHVFLLQKVHVLFSFKLNSPIYQVENKLRELKDQMKFGLLLNPNENLYVKLTNLEGSTIAPPTIVHTYIVLAVGHHQPSLPRLKQLAQNIRNSSEANLGLNRTVFGKVKQIRLSSFLQHSLTNGHSNGSPSPAPEPHPVHHDHHLHHHHHHHSHHHGPHVAHAPTGSNYQTQAPSGCRYGFSSKPYTKDHLAPASAPVTGMKQSAAPAPAPASQHSTARTKTPLSSAAPSSTTKNLLAPHGNQNPPTPASHMPPVSPSPEAQSPSESSRNNKSPDKAPPNLLASYSSSVSGKISLNWVGAILFVLVGL